MHAELISVNRLSAGVGRDVGTPRRADGQKEFSSPFWSVGCTKVEEECRSMHVLGPSGDLAWDWDMQPGGKHTQPDDSETAPNLYEQSLCSYRPHCVLSSLGARENARCHR
jgi:hypothetical protein